MFQKYDSKRSTKRAKHPLTSPLLPVILQLGGGGIKQKRKRTHGHRQLCGNCGMGGRRYKGTKWLMETIQKMPNNGYLCLSSYTKMVKWLKIYIKLSVKCPSFSKAIQTSLWILTKLLTVCSRQRQTVEYPVCKGIIPKALKFLRRY